MTGFEDIPPGEKLAQLLKLSDVGNDVYRNVGKDRNANGEVFGGQYLALAVSAAMRSAGGRAPHALQGFFLRSADAELPVDYVVERTRDGRAFSHRRVTALQGGKEAFRAEVSLHDWEDGQPSHSASPPTVPPPEDLVRHHDFVRENAAVLDPVTVRRVLGRTSFENCFRRPGLTVVASNDEPALNVWVYPNDPPPSDDPVAFYATLAYLSDSCGNFSSRTIHAANLFDGSTMSATLNHSVWFHARPRPIGWILYVMDSPFAGGGLGYNRGTMYDREGNVLASVVQEALIRWGQ